MKLTHVLLFITFAYAIPTDSNSSSNEDSKEEGDSGDFQLPDRWLEVPLDHFNLFDNRTFKMRYFVNDEFFKKGQPLFVEIGGEATMSAADIKSGQLYLLAKKHEGMLVHTEHRYYGKSLPFSTDFSVENLKYLQIEQALEDLAYFIDYYKSITPGLKDSKVVVHGCSYPGMLATWIRLRFPHLVDIAYASSAPLGVGLDYPEYFEIVNDVYANVSVSCINTIKEGFKTASKLLKTKDGRKIVKKALKKWDCGDIDDMNSYEILQNMLNILNVQNDPLNYEEVSCLVLSMDADDMSPFHRLAKLVILKSQDMQTCGDEVDDAAAKGEKERNDVAWSYQTCTEMGTFQTLNRANSKHPFTLDSTIQESVDQCVDEFGGMVTEEVLVTGTERVTRRYGGKKPKVTKVVTVQGTDDPWKHLSHLEDYNPEAPVFVVKGSHCIDLIATEHDPEELIKTRKKVRDIVSDWLNEIS